MREGRGKRVEYGKDSVALFRIGPTIHAISNICPHMGTELYNGDVEGLEVTCPWHHWKFDLTTGMSNHRTKTCIDVYEVDLRDDDIWIRPPEPKPEPDAPADNSDDEWVVWDDKFLKGGERQGKD